MFYINLCGPILAQFQKSRDLWSSLCAIQLDLLSSTVACLLVHLSGGQITWMGVTLLELFATTNIFFTEVQLNNKKSMLPSATIGLLSSVVLLLFLSYCCMVSIFVWVWCSPLLGHKKTKQNGIVFIMMIPAYNEAALCSKQTTRTGIECQAGSFNAKMSKMDWLWVSRFHKYGTGTGHGWKSGKEIKWKKLL